MCQLLRLSLIVTQFDILGVELSKSIDFDDRKSIKMFRKRRGMIRRRGRGTGGGRGRGREEKGGKGEKKYSICFDISIQFFGYSSVDFNHFIFGGHVQKKKRKFC